MGTEASGLQGEGSRWPEQHKDPGRRALGADSGAPAGVQPGSTHETDKAWGSQGPLHGHASLHITIVPLLSGPCLPLPFRP